MKFEIQLAVFVLIVANAICGNSARTVDEAQVIEDDTSAEIFEGLYDDFRDLRNKIDSPETAATYSTKSLGSTHQVSTTSGGVTGSIDENAFTFYGIPFAEPPVGSLRFKYPQPINTPTSTVDATVNQGVYCEQTHGPCIGFNCITYSEDCLVLNVFVPTDVDFSDTSKIAAKPVMVFIHGGAFFMGSANTPAYDGKWFAGITNTVVVAMNYRLGPFGFLSFDDGSNTIDGNLGLRDQRLALQWVQDNIANFGGNPTSVTIFGESAGAQSVMFHLLSDQSDPLFHRAIMQSIPAVFPYHTPAEGQVLTKKMTDYMKCSSLETYKCLMDASPLDLISAGVAAVQYDALLVDHNVYDLIEPFRPYIDGVEFKLQPLEAFKQGKWQNNKKLIIGTNSEEVDPLYEINPLKPFPILTQSLYKSLNNFVYGTDIGPTVSDYYMQLYSGEKYGDIFSKEMTDSFFVCPSRAAARFAAQASDVYLYSNTHPRQAGTCDDNAMGRILCGYSYHASELVFVFQSGEGANEYIYQSGDYRVQEQFADYWANFAYNDNPSHKSNYGSTAETWPLYSNNQNIQIQNPAASVQSDYKNVICDFWDNLNFYVDM